MIYNSRKAREIEVEGVKFLAKPFTVLQQAEFAEILNAENSNKSRLNAIYDSVEYLFRNVVENITGLKDYEGCEIDFANTDKRVLAEGLKVEDIINITNAISEANLLLDSDKKKSLSQAQFGAVS